MKTILSQFLLLLIPAIMFAQNIAKPEFRITGYAATSTSQHPEGTTGGEGGREVTPTTIEELKKFAKSEEPLIIRIEREFKGPAQVKLNSNKTLIGIGADGFLNQVNLNINSKQNIIIRNIKFSMKDVPVFFDGENKIEGTNSDPDCITMQADDDDLAPEDRITSHIWIDHCEFYNEDPYVMTDYDRYDGLVDMKNNCTNITVSWNYFHDHHKACLIGNGKSDKFDRHVTFHNNYFKNIKSRLPLCRFGNVHFFNNYINECNDGTNARINTELCIERNVYKNSKKPVFGKMEEECKANLIDNIFSGCRALPVGESNSDNMKFKNLNPTEEFSKTDYKPEYKYDDVLLPVESVEKTVENWSGIGKI